MGTYRRTTHHCLCIVCGTDQRRSGVNTLALVRGTAHYTARLSTGRGLSPQSPWSEEPDVTEGAVQLGSGVGVGSGATGMNSGDRRRAVLGGRHPVHTVGGKGRG